jgi:uncharacterized membrane protein YraQ (UPF0718 family)
LTQLEQMSIALPDNLMGRGEVEPLQSRPLPVGYRLSLGGFVVSLALTLLTLVDFRRGFLFSAAEGYLSRTPYFSFSPWHLPMLFIGLVGIGISYMMIRSYESVIERHRLEKYVRWLAFTLFGLLVIDLFTYRGVPAARAAMAGNLRAGWLEAFGATGWLRPVALAVSYLLTVWHATFLGVLLSGLALTVLPRYLRSFFTRTGLGGSLFGAAFALPQPFCSCCASVITPSLVKQGASNQFSLAFMIGSPMLNITTLILAVLLLPAPYAIIRIVAGILLTVPVTYLVARMSDRWLNSPKQPPRNVVAVWISRWVDLYCRVFHLDELVKNRPLDKPGQFLPAWLAVSGRIALLLVTTLLLWSIVTAAVVQILPSTFGNNLASVVISAVFGTLLMISTWTEIPVALQMIQAGFAGPASTLLVTLPPVSLPCLLILGGAWGRFRVVAVLGFVVVLIGIGAGIFFL